ncbi:cardiolipin synthase [Pseudaminobacter salicylatoxidans]|uniref:cardiolipin synthase n=1 Tax=Pseudaminobacter salicylatoxidans TaxID=93369 RepID=UPI0002DF362F|nr:cardiolipin synthase [Pseudaminobacter salicylatoxidans]
MIGTAYIGSILVALHIILQITFIIRALLRPYREPASRLAWIVVIAVAPVVGILAYVLFGDANIGRRRIARMRAALKRLPSLSEISGGQNGRHRRYRAIPKRYTPLFRVGQSISSYPPVGGNSARLLEDSDASITAMVDDIDAATDHVHLLFYIWLADNNGLKMVEALKRAAARGVTCRAMVDDLGSRALIRSVHWKDMAAAGVRLARALPIGNPLSRPFKGRIDMRNHRKIVVIDNRVTYCGSQNCADAAFAVKARFAPWVDIMMRFEGPVVRQNQHLFASDWMGHVNEDLSDMLRQPIAESEPGFAAQVVGTGATVRYSAMPEMFVAMMNAARRELVITTPYYVPDEPIQAALCASAHRGVATTIIFPRRNDSWIVAGASRSYYRELLEAGVRIHEYVGGLLHTKSMTVDGEVTLIGSANMDRRSFELNSENNILFCDPELTADMRARQQSYIEASVPVELAEVAQWRWPRRLWNNTIAMLGPLL